MILKFSKNIYEDKLMPVPSGDRKAYNYSLSFDKETGQECLVGEEYDIQDVIDSYADQCSIARILELNGLGDDSILNNKPGVYLDEEAVKYSSMALDSAGLNTELFKLYQPYKDEFTFEEFSNAIVHGDFKLFDKKVEKKEEGNA